MWHKLIVLGPGLVALLALAACSKAAPVPTPSAPTANNAVVRVTLDEWHLTPSVASAPAGYITVEAVDTGTDDHEVVILKTDKAANALVVRNEASVDKSKVDETASGDNVGEVEVEAGVTQAATFKLTPGHYVFICNTEAHYKKGMFADFTVQ